jgi:hypothetical protein
MNRVWKKFLIKISKTIALFLLAITIFVGVVVLLMFLRISFPFAMLFTLVICIFLPMIGILLKAVYDDCKIEVDRENKKIIRDLQGF